MNVFFSLCFLYGPPKLATKYEGEQFGCCFGVAFRFVVWFPVAFLMFFLWSAERNWHQDVRGCIFWCCFGVCCFGFSYGFLMRALCFPYGLLSELGSKMWGGACLVLLWCGVLVCVMVSLCLLYGFLIACLPKSETRCEGEHVWCCFGGIVFSRFQLFFCPLWFAYCEPILFITFVLLRAIGLHA